jgi:4-oxalocrotonate tautomerase
MLVLKITLLEGRDAETKAQLIRRLNEAAAQHLQEPAEDIRIILYEVPPENWGAGGITIKERSAKLP